MVTREHESMMRWAIALALEGAGRTSPNPVVGAVVVKGGRIVGEGFHQRAGTPHAEVHALRAAGKRARGADLYVTLEPCCHEGRTPPCVEAIVAAGVRRVIVGTRDPNPIVHGRGIRLLRRAGIRVVEGVLEESCRAINEAYNKFIKSGLPYVTAKVALSLDGKIAAASGDARWITGSACRRYVHELRSNVDAVVVGGGTVRRDDPRLTVRIPGAVGARPRAVVIDEALRLPRAAHLLARPEGMLVLVTTAQAPLARIRAADRRGHRVLICPCDAAGRVHLPSALHALGREGITSILLEGGGQLFADAVAHGLVDRLVACIAPKLLGGKGLDFLPGLAIRRMKDAIELRDVAIRTFGTDVVIEGRLK
jgi:diaminohydroxyphosphoribosylaminopyrimidine deaminase / 5-amino-6-(5-phosphoribosylamino)uracil reductase